MVSDILVAHPSGPFFSLSQKEKDEFITISIQTLKNLMVLIMSTKLVLEVFNLDKIIISTQKLFYVNLNDFFKC